MRMMELAPWSRSSIGFDRLFDMLENARRSEHADNYPPYNIERPATPATASLWRWQASPQLSSRSPLNRTS